MLLLKLPGVFSHIGRAFLKPLRGLLPKDFLRAYSQAVKVLVSGAGGLVGSALVPFLSSAGHEIVQLTRAQSAAADRIRWDPLSGYIDKEGLHGIEAAVHLASESINGRWTAAKKRRILESRDKGTRLLAETFGTLEPPPKVLVSASAVGYYGDRGGEFLREDSGPGEMFLSQVCQVWEGATEPALEAGIRVVNLRLGIILSPAGGALRSLLLPMRLGLGGRIGSGEQYMSWVALDDAVGAIHHALITDGLAGPVNVTSPQQARNRDFTKTLGRVLRRPTVFPLPAFAARLLLGQMADELLLVSARADPARLTTSGYEFRYPGLEDALRHLLMKPAP